MELRHLILIDTVATEGTLSRASEKLHLTQSALSHQLKEIEAELGILMFNRVNKRLVISDAGNIIRRASINIQKELLHANREVDRLKNGVSGKIRLSTECYTCYHWLPEVIQSMEGSCKQIELMVLPEYTKRHFEGLLNDELDLVITSQKSSNPDIKYEELFQDEQLLIVSKNHPLSTLPFVLPVHFKDETLLIYNFPKEEASIYSDFLRPSGVEPARFMEMRLTESAIQLIKRNMGIKVMAKWAAQPYLETGDLVGVRIGPESWYRKWYLAYHKQAGWKKHYTTFKQHLRESLNSGILAE